MTPGIHNITIYRGASFSESLQFYVKGTTTPIVVSEDLKAEVRAKSKGPLVIAITVDNTNNATGKFTLSATEENTRNLPLRTHIWGLMGKSTGILYVIGTCSIEPIAPEK